MLQAGRAGAGYGLLNGLGFGGLLFLGAGNRETGRKPVRETGRENPGKPVRETGQPELRCFPSQASRASRFGPSRRNRTPPDLSLDIRNDFCRVR